jgi:hypothetical protein
MHSRSHIPATVVINFAGSEQFLASLFGRGLLKEHETKPLVYLCEPTPENPLTFSDFTLAIYRASRTTTSQWMDKQMEELSTVVDHMTLLFNEWDLKSDNATDLVALSQFWTEAKAAMQTLTQNIKEKVDDREDTIGNEQERHLIIETITKNNYPSQLPVANAALHAHVNAKAIWHKSYSVAVHNWFLEGANNSALKKKGKGESRESRERGSADKAASSAEGIVVGSCLPFLTTASGCDAHTRGAITVQWSYSDAISPSDKEKLFAVAALARAWSLSYYLPTFKGLQESLTIPAFERPITVLLFEKIYHAQTLAECVTATMGGLFLESHPLCPFWVRELLLLARDACSMLPVCVSKASTPLLTWNDISISDQGNRLVLVNCGGLCQAAQWLTPMAEGAAQHIKEQAQAVEEYFLCSTANIVLQMLQQDSVLSAGLSPQMQSLLRLCQDGRVTLDQLLSHPMFAPDGPAALSFDEVAEHWRQMMENRVA